MSPPLPEDTIDEDPGAPSPSSKPASESPVADSNARHASSESATAGGPDAMTDATRNDEEPQRSKRKKARRACFACQRAHLTCDDNRPCKRCVKRGLQDQCHDGVRKMAKYLQNDPAAASAPGFPSVYSLDVSQPATAQSRPASLSSAVNMPPSGQQDFYPSSTSMDYTQYASVGGQAELAQPMVGPNALLENVGASSAFQSTVPQQIDQNTGLTGTNNPIFDPAFDPNNTNPFDFGVIGDIDFDSRYGAMEWNVLTHMSNTGGGGGGSDLELLESMNQSQSGNMYENFAQPFNNGSSAQPWSLAPDAVTGTGYSGVPWPMQRHNTDAFTVGEHSSVYSPLSQSHEFHNPFSPDNKSPGDQFMQTDRSGQSAQQQQQQQQQQQELLRRSISQAQQQLHQQQQQSTTQPSGFPKVQAPAASRRRLETSDIYNSVTAPYPYTQGFHSLIAFLQKHFPAKKVLSIAKSLASIRPSFILCNKNLTRDDLIFMEKCFQRTLIEYGDLVHHCGTPTLIIRRTGEIAAVNKELSLITGWRRDILLGREPNLNVNVGVASGTASGTVSRGAATPRMPPTAELDTSRPQPVFIAEILDEDSVVQFYEDFAELAFGASRGSIIGRPCSLLKYRTKNDIDLSSSVNAATASVNESGRPSSRPPGTAGADALGQRTGRVDCQLCWTVKRDVFDIPMMIVMNVSNTGDRNDG